MFKLTSLILLFCVSTHVFADDIPEELKEMIKNLHNQCVGETGVSEAAIADANNGKFNGEESLKCYMKCLMASVGIIDDDGVFDGEAFVDLLPNSMKSHGEKLVKACKPEGSNACDVAYNLNLCNYNLDPSKYTLY
uniref:Odorant-binding protein n=1 Tax=Phenacoccus solenopsis TaxID=483260 RepID=A0A0U2WTY6_9HEMI|nr:odorant-binding protein [Phenacoccus solenopsis]